MNQLDGQNERYPGPAQGIVLGDIEVGDTILSCFVDLKEDEVLILVQGPLEAHVFHRRDSIYMIEGIEMAGVKLQEYFEVFNSTLMNTTPPAQKGSPLPSPDDARKSLLKEARSQRSQISN